jgi:hypothetical protein
MKKRVFWFFLCISVPLYASEFVTLKEIVIRMNDVRYDRIMGVDGFDWTMRVYPEDKTVLITYGSTNDYANVRAELTAWISRTFKPSRTKRYTQEYLEKKHQKMLSISNPVERAKVMQEHYDGVFHIMMNNEFASLSSSYELLNAQVSQAWDVLEDILLDERYKDYRIVVSGHSYAALLAEAVASRALLYYYVGHWSRPVYAVNVASFGANGAVKNYLPQSVLEHYIHGYNRYGDVVARLGASMGHNIIVSDWWEEGLNDKNSYNLLVIKTLANHNLVEFILGLDANNIDGLIPLPWEMPDHGITPRPWEHF